jgi:hypothetical protein
MEREREKKKGGKVPDERYLVYSPRKPISRATSPLLRMLRLELLLRRRRLRVSAGSAGLNPLARAYRLRTSVRLITPTRWPDNRAPGKADAGMEGA